MMQPREHYTHGHHESVLKSHTWRTIANSAAYLEPHLAGGLSLLDVGCGPGTITVEFADRLAPGRVVGVDAAAEVIAKAAASFTRPNLEFLVGDAYALPFDDGTFDIAHTHQTLQHLADPAAALRELRRVVRPGGVVAARDVDYAGVIWFPLHPGLTRWLDLYERVHRSNGGRTRCGPATEGVGAAGGLHRGDDHGIRLELLRRRRPRMVGEHVGGPRARVGVRHRRPQQGPRDPRRTREHLGGVASLGR